MTRAKYIELAAAKPRAELLRACRAGGLTVHAASSNEQIAEILWRYFGKRFHARGPKCGEG